MTAPHARLTFTTTTGNSKKQKLPPNRLNLAIVPFHSSADQPEGTCPAAFTSLTLRTRAINSFVANNGPAIDYNIMIRKRNQQKRNEQNVKTHCWFHCALILHKAMHWSLFHFTLIFVINSFVFFYFIYFGLWSSTISVAIMVAWWHWRKAFVLRRSKRRGKNCDEVCCNCPLF